MTPAGAIPGTEAAAIEAAASYHAAQQALGAYRVDPAAGTEAVVFPGLAGVAFGPHRGEAARLWALHLDVARAACALEEALALHGEPVAFGWWTYGIDFETGRAFARRRRG